MARHERDVGKERWWRRQVRQWRRSRLSVRNFCRQEGLSEPSFYGWRRTLAERARQQVQARAGGVRSGSASRTCPRSPRKRGSAGAPGPDTSDQHVALGLDTRAQHSTLGSDTRARHSTLGASTRGKHSTLNSDRHDSHSTHTGAPIGLFAPMRLLGASAGAGSVEVVCRGGRVVRVSSGFDRAALREVLGVLEELP